MLRSGDRALLLEAEDAATRRRWDHHLSVEPLAGVAEVVPAATTLGLVLDGTRTAEEVAREVLARGPAEDIDHLDVGREAQDAAVLEIPVVYDGPDLAEVAALNACGRDDVVAWHSGQVWTCDFVGFLPGFGYLVGEGPVWQVPRRSDPRPRVPAGAVALAGCWTGVYPQSSPGGWQLIGHTGITLWDPHRERPALISVGARIRFVEVGG